MSDDVFREVHCAFYERTDADDGQFHYRRAYPHTPDGSGMIRTTCPPAVGDLVSVRDQSEDGPSGTFRVIERAWMHPSFGSAHWPHVGGVQHGPILDLIVVADPGPFRDEAPVEDGNDD